MLVLGHYDSRGGTTAIPLPDNPTEADVRAAMKRYDQEIFGIEESGDPIQRTVYGMPARVADQMVHKLVHEDRLPSEEDFLFVADLYGNDDPQGDLQEQGSVLVDHSDSKWETDDLGEAIANSLAHPTQLEFVPCVYSHHDSDEDREKEEIKIKGLAQILKNPEYRDWSDDAFGFYIHTRD
jgi:hypothetical protein